MNCSLLSGEFEDDLYQQRQKYEIDIFRILMEEEKFVELFKK